MDKEDPRDQNQFYCRGFSGGAPAPVSAPAAPGPGWTRPRELTWADEALALAFRRSRGGFCRPGGAGGFELAYPLECRLPFPLPPLFCFAHVECLCGRGWWVFSFDADGLPRFPGA